MEFFKKGQLVPKRLGVAICHKKQRHHIVFGVDCVYDYQLKIFHVVDSDGSLVNVSANISRVKTGNGTFKKVKNPSFSISACRIPGLADKSIPQQEVINDQ